MSKTSNYRMRPRRKEWIELSGGTLCLWSFRAADVNLIGEYSTRPAEDPRGGIDTLEASIWQIAFACYDGDGPDAKRLWPDLKAYEIRDMPADDWEALVLAINRLNGKDATSQEVMRDFTPAEPEQTSSILSTGASAISAAS